MKRQVNLLCNQRVTVEDGQNACRQCYAGSVAGVGATVCSRCLVGQVGEPMRGARHADRQRPAGGRRWSGGWGARRQGHTADGAEMVRWSNARIERVTKSHWYDVMFSDGKLWCKVLPSERGLRWVLIG